YQHCANIASHANDSPRTVACLPMGHLDSNWSISSLALVDEPNFAYTTEDASKYQPICSLASTCCEATCGTRLPLRLTCFGCVVWLNFAINVLPEAPTFKVTWLPFLLAWHFTISCVCARSSSSYRMH